MRKYRAFNEKKISGRIARVLGALKSGIGRVAKQTRSASGSALPCVPHGTASGHKDPSCLATTAPIDRSGRNCYHDAFATVETARPGVL